MEWERTVYTEETGEAKNGYDPRKELRTSFGPIRDLKTPRTRGERIPQIFLNHIHNTWTWLPWGSRWVLKD